MSQKILLATRNAHKTQEVRAILGPGWSVEDLLAHPGLPEVEETGTTFAENAALKALAGSRHFPEGWVIADDSGLEVDALGGEPGIYSARYAGPDADDEANRQKLSRELRVVLRGEPGVYSARYAGPDADDEANRQKLSRELRAVLRLRSGDIMAARFRCCIAVARGGGLAGSFDGVVEGMVIPVARGEGGFGYDPMFIPAGYQDTFAELPAEIKNRLSHRGSALRQAAEFLRAEP